MSSSALIHSTVATGVFACATVAFWRHRGRVRRDSALRRYRERWQVLADAADLALTKAARDGRPVRSAGEVQETAWSDFNLAATESEAAMALDTCLHTARWSSLAR